MANRKLDKKLDKAAQAYKKGDRRAGSRLLNEILLVDFYHEGAWQLLYQKYGRKREFQEFKREFTQKYYPDKLSLLDQQAQSAPAVQTSSTTEQKKGSLFSRLIAKFRRKPKTSQVAAGQAGDPSARQDTQPQPASSAKPTVNRVTLQTAQPQETEKAPPPAAPPPVSIRKPAPVKQIQTGSPHPAPRVSAGTNNNKIRVMVVDDIDITRENIIRALQFEDHIEVVGFAKNGTQAIELAHHYDPNVIVMDVNMPDMDGLTATAYIRRELPATQVVILTVQDDVDYMRQAMMAGARDFLTKPPMIHELVTAVENANKFAIEAREKAQLLATARMHAAAMAQTGHIISIYSPRGGSGCSTLAANLAASLHTEDTPVVVVDGNLQFGDIPVLFNVQCKGNLFDLAVRAQDLDADLVNDVVTMHSSGIGILAPPKPENAERITGDQFSQVLRYLSRLFSYVIVDTQHRIEDVNLAGFDVSDLVMVVITQDIPSIARLRRFIDLYDLLKFDPNNLILVMNRYDRRVGIDPDKLEKNFRHQVAVTIPDQIQIVLPAINRGVPLMLKPEMHPTPIAQAISELSGIIRERISQLQEVEAQEEAVEV